MRTWILLSIILFFSSFSVLGQWYETKGHASLEKSTVELARTKAVENALKKALLVSGASVSSVQQVVNGLLTQDQINIRASGSINSIELIDELHSNDMITVTIRADIFPQEKKCFAVDFKKSLLITRSHLMHREQANIGQIYTIDNAVMNKLSEKLSQQSGYIKTNGLFKSKTEFSRLNNGIHNNKIKQLTLSLSDNTGSQYILYSEINDVSFEESSTNSWKVWQQSIYPRIFDLTLYIYNGINGELVWQKQYQQSAPWSFDKRKNVDVNGLAFWQSHYGNMLNKLIDTVINDIDESIMCEPSKGKIIQVNGNQIIIDLGRHHGVKIGDEFSLLHLNNFTAPNGKTYVGYNVSAYKVKVTQLTKQSATAITSDNSLLGNIQINDLAVRY
ncbi:MAG: flagellar assembly protein FlgT [Colwellia sp.]